MSHSFGHHVKAEYSRQAVSYCQYQPLSYERGPTFP